MADSTARILIIEDDVGKRYTITRVLRQGGFEVLEARDGAEGLALVKDIPDLVILDIKLPDASGLDICRQIKAAPETAQVLVLAVSARYTSAPDRTRGLDHGADAYLVHPVDGDELIATVRALLRLRAAERDRQRLTGEVEAGERRYRTITETTTVGLCLLDADGRCTFLNRAAEAMFDGGPVVIGRPLHDVLAPQLADGTPIAREDWAITRMLRDGGSVPPGRLTVRGARGERLHVELSANPILVGAQRVGAVVEVKPIEELVRAERQRDLFLATLGHDLRGPLQTMAFGASTLERSPTLGTRERDTIARMMSSTHRMERLIEHILAFARTLVEGVPLAPRQVDLVQVCAAVVRDAAARERTRPIELGGEPSVIGTWDPDRLTQVFDNLIGNAVRHGDGLVSATIARDGTDAVVTIHNLGRPIPAGAIATLFDPFKRASERAGGVGLGLYIADQNVRAHGGTIAVTSSAEHGTTFTVRLPIA